MKGGKNAKTRIPSLAKSEAQGERNYEVAAQQLVNTDNVLGRLIARIGPCGLEKELRPITTTFEALLEAITHQQLSTKAASTIFARVCALAPDLDPELFRSLGDPILRNAGLSRAKVLAVRDLAERTCTGEVPSMEALHEMDDESIVENLSRIRGIGRWSAEMLLIFRLGRLDVLPIHDLGIQRGFTVSFRKTNKPIAKAIKARGERWRPYRSVASWYLWRAAETTR